MESRSLIRAVPAVIVGMVIGGLVAFLSLLLLIYAEHSFEDPTLTLWALVGATSGAILGTILALPLSCLAVLFWIQRRPVQKVVKIGLGYSLVPLLIFFDGIELQNLLQRGLGFERHLFSYILLIVLNCVAWPLAGWATYKSAPWFNKV